MTRDEINEITALVNGVEERLSRRIAAVEERIMGVEEPLSMRIAAVEERITEVEERLSTRIIDLETKLLTAFHEWASPVEQHQRSHREPIRVLDLEYEALKTRLRKLEREWDAA